RQQLMENQIPDASRYQEMIQHNAAIYKQLVNQTELGIQQVLDLPQLSEIHEAPSPTLSDIVHLESEKFNLMNELQRKNNLLEASRVEIQELKKSASYRFGMFVLYPLRKSKQFFKQLSKN